MNMTQMGLFLTQKVSEIGELANVAEEVTESAAKEASKKMQLFDQLISDITDWGIGIVKSLIIAFLIYFIGKKIAKWILKVLNKFFERSSMDEGVAKFLMSISKIVLYGILFISVVGELGIPTSSFIALLGSAGVAIGLALQGSLANFAGGVLILILKPFRMGDYIIVQGFEGKVTDIDIFYTKLLTIDNRFVVIPNGTMSNAEITNVTNEEVRRLDLLIDVDYSENIKHVKEVLYRVASRHELALQEDYVIDVYVNSFEASAIQMGLRVWVQTDHYFKLKCELMEQILEAFNEENITIPYNHLDVNLIK